MNIYKPDSDESLRIKNEIGTRSMRVEEDGSIDPFDEVMMKLDVKELAEKYAIARSIEPHANVRLFKARLENEFGYYLCPCGKTHTYEEMAKRFIRAAIVNFLAQFQEGDFSVSDAKNDYYVSGILRHRAEMILTIIVGSLSP